MLNSNMKSQAGLVTAWPTKLQCAHTENARTEISITVTKKTVLKFIHKINSCSKVLCSWHSHCLSTVAC